MCSRPRTQRAAKTMHNAGMFSTHPLSSRRPGVPWRAASLRHIRVMGTRVPSCEVAHCLSIVYSSRRKPGTSVRLATLLQCAAQQLQQCIRDPGSISLPAAKHLHVLGELLQCTTQAAQCMSNGRRTAPTGSLTPASGISAAGAKPATLAHHSSVMGTPVPPCKVAHYCSTLRESDKRDALGSWFLTSRKAATARM